MKKFISILFSLTLLFSVVGGTLVDAKSHSSSRSSSSSFSKSSGSKSSSSSKSSGWGSIKTSKPSKSSTSSKSKTKEVKLDKQKLKKSSTVSSTKKAKEKAKYKPKYSSSNYKPSGYNYSRYNNKPYYNSSSGFSTSLLTAVGTYLVLDSFNDDGEPVYIDSETGKALTQDELNDLDLQDDSDEMSTTGIVFMTLIIVIMLAMFGFFIFRVLDLRF